MVLPDLHPKPTIPHSKYLPTAPRSWNMGVHKGCPGSFRAAKPELNVLKDVSLPISPAGCSAGSLTGKALVPQERSDNYLFRGDFSLSSLSL